jgi:hypothetical protein
MFVTSSSNICHCTDFKLLAFFSMQTEHSSNSTSFSMRGTQTTSTTRPLPDPIPIYKPSQPDSYYPPTPNLCERIWDDRYNFLLQMGLQLRPSYRPGWTPSRLNAKGEFVVHEDSVQHLVRLCFHIRIRYQLPFLSSYLR